MPTIDFFSKRSNRALFAGSLGVAIAASFAWIFYQTRKKRVKQKGSVHPQSEPETHKADTSLVEDEMPVKRGGRRNYRAEKVEQTEESSPQPPSPQKDVYCGQKSPLQDLPPSELNCSWSEEVERQQVTQLSNNFASQCVTAAEEQSSLEVQRVLQPQQSRSPVSHVSPPTVQSAVKNVHTTSYRPLESPSVASDLHSEASADSGRGGSTGVASSMSPVDEMAEIGELLPIYEFEIPQSLVGLIIGIKGKTIKELCQRSNCKMIIRQHDSYKKDFQICTVEGKRENINFCLQMLRRKFPPSRFPELNLKPVLPPPISSPVIWDKTSSLTLPEGVPCEVQLSCMQDPGHLFLQQPTHNTFPNLSRLDSYMMFIYAQNAGIPQLPRPVTMDIVCVAPGMHGWFRAITVAFYEDMDEVLVKFVDYGGYVRLPASDLKQIRNDFLTLPFQAVECYLANVEPIDGVTDGWSHEACARFEQLAGQQVIEAKVVGSAEDKVPLVQLFATDADNQPLDLARILVEEGFARWAPSEPGR